MDVCNWQLIIAPTRMWLLINIFLYTSNSASDGLSIHSLFGPECCLTDSDWTHALWVESNSDWQTLDLSAGSYWPHILPSEQHGCAVSVHLCMLCHSARMRHRAKKRRNTNKPIYWSNKIAACWRGLFIYWLDREMRSVFGFLTDLLVWGTTYFHFWWCSCRGSSETRRETLWWNHYFHRELESTIMLYLRGSQPFFLALVWIFHLSFNSGIFVTLTQFGTALFYH